MNKGSDFFKVLLSRGQFWQPKSHSNFQILYELVQYRINQGHN
jgi:hypothetical protein